MRFLVFLQVCVYACVCVGALVHWSSWGQIQMFPAYLLYIIIAQLRNTEVSKMMTEKIESGLYRCFGNYLFNNFISYIRTSKLNIINPTDNGRETPPLRCYISNQAFGVQLDIKPPISPRYIRGWTNICLALILIFTEPHCGYFVFSERQCLAAPAT